jgi:hypothetical protein
MEVRCRLHASAALIPGKDPGTHWTEGWVGPTASMDAVVKAKNPFPAPAGIRISVVQAVAESLYWLSYSDSNYTIVM